MTTGVLRLGARGPEVKALQERLNAALRPSPSLVPDGTFGVQTRMAVLRFQRDNWLVDDGEAGPCTRNALFGKEAYAPILHSLPFIAQPTPTVCWAASTAMMTRSTVAAVFARTPPDMIMADGSLANYSGSDQAMTAGRRFGQAHGLQATAPMSWPATLFRSRLAQGPLMLDMLWEAGTYAQGVASPGHMIVVVGIRGDDEPSGRGTTLRIFDPWPPRQGKRYSVGYLKWIQEVPTRTYRVFQR